MCVWVREAGGACAVRQNCVEASAEADPDPMDASPTGRPPPRSSSIKANLCKLLAGKGTRSSYALNSKKKLTKSGWSCSSLSTATSFDHAATNCSLTRLTEEYDPSNTMRNLSLSKSSDLIEDLKSESSFKPNQVQDGRAAISSLPATDTNSNQDEAAMFQAKRHPAALLSDKVIMREKSSASGGRQQRPKSEYTVSNPVVQMRSHRPNKSTTRHSTFEVLFPFAAVWKSPLIPCSNRDIICNLGS